MSSLRQQLTGAQAEIEEYRLREWASYHALGYGEPTNDALPHLIDGMMGLNARLQDSLDSIARAVGFIAKDEPLSTWVDRMVKERDAAQKACAEMRDVVGRIKVCIEFSGLQNSMWERYQELCHALSTDCGKDYVPRAELEKVMNAERREQARLINERDAAQKACAEMRSELGRIKSKPWAHILTQEDRENIGRVLSSDCGSGYVPRAELDRLKAANKVLVEALEQCIKQCDYMPAHKGLIQAQKLNL